MGGGGADGLWPKTPDVLHQHQHPRAQVVSGKRPSVRYEQSKSINHPINQ